MKKFLYLLFILCMGVSLSVVVLSFDEAIQLVASVQFLLSTFALALTIRLL